MVPAVPAGTQGSQQTKRPVVLRTKLAPSLRKKKRKHGVSCEPAASHTRSRMPSDSSPDLTPHALPGACENSCLRLCSEDGLSENKLDWPHSAAMPLLLSTGSSWSHLTPVTAAGLQTWFSQPMMMWGINLLFFLPVKLRQSVSSKLLRELVNMGTY